jgi:hypothetical protein
VNGETNGKSRFDWRVVAVSIGLVMAQGLVQWGITSATLLEHSRRIEVIEKRMEERSVAREEYERRHEDLTKRVEELAQQIREFERQKR